MNVRPSLRWRLTALYAALFLFAGGVLLLINYRLVENSLPEDKIGFATVGPGLPGDVIRDIKEQVPVPNPVLERRLAIIVNGKPSDAAFIESLPGRLRERALNDLLARSLVGLALVAVASVTLGWWLSGRALRPIHRITETARRLSETNLDERIALEGPDDELRELADTFDAMLERLDTAFDSQRRFVANASHELRTPLAIMRTQLETAQTPEELSQASEVVQKVIERSERLVDGLLVLARAGGALDLQAVDLADSVRAMMSDEGFEPVLEPAPVDGDPALLAHLARNLLDNARQYNTPDGWVRVRTGVEGDDAVLIVENSGPVVPADAVDAIFEPFRRLAPERTAADTSSGLGLSIVRAVAQAHNGDVTAVPRGEGGLRVEVRLPLAVATVSARPRA